MANNSEEENLLAKQDSDQDPQSSVPLASASSTGTTPAPNAQASAAQTPQTPQNPQNPEFPIDKQYDYITNKLKDLGHEIK